TRSEPRNHRWCRRTVAAERIRGHSAGERDSARGACAYRRRSYSIALGQRAFRTRRARRRSPRVGKEDWSVGSTRSAAIQAALRHARGSASGGRQYRAGSAVCVRSEIRPHAGIFRTQKEIIKKQMRQRKGKDMAVPEKVGVLGGGRMGAGIAHAFLAAGATVKVVDINDDAVAAAKARVEKAIQGSLDRGAEGSFDSWAQRLTLSTDVSEFAGFDLVVEAVPESMELKTTAFSNIAKAAPEAVIATNTSSLSVSQLADTVANDVIGLHFFNPVPASKLVEVVIAESTPEALVETAKGWVEALGKTAVVVKDA